MAFIGLFAVMIIAMCAVIGIGIAGAAFMLFLSRRHMKKHADDGKGRFGYVVFRILALLCFVPALFVIIGIVSAGIISNVA